MYFFSYIIFFFQTLGACVSAEAEVRERSYSSSDLRPHVTSLEPGPSAGVSLREPAALTRAGIVALYVVTNELISRCVRSFSIYVLAAVQFL